jgi:hypothetical protein
MGEGTTAWLGMLREFCDMMWWAPEGSGYGDLMICCLVFVLFKHGQRTFPLCLEDFELKGALCIVSGVLVELLHVIVPLWCIEAVPWHSRVACLGSWRATGVLVLRTALLASTGIVWSSSSAHAVFCVHFWVRGRYLR